MLVINFTVLVLIIFPREYFKIGYITYTPFFSLSPIFCSLYSILSLMPHFFPYPPFFIPYIPFFPLYPIFVLIPYIFYSLYSIFFLIPHLIPYTPYFFLRPYYSSLTPKEPRPFFCKKALKTAIL